MLYCKLQQVLFIDKPLPAIYTSHSEQLFAPPFASKVAQVLWHWHV